MIADNNVVVLTGTQLRELIADVVRETIERFQKPANQSESGEPRRYVYGLRGIRELFNCAHSTAQEYKNTFLKPAIKQRGRKIQVDADLAIKLFDEYKNQK